METLSTLKCQQLRCLAMRLATYIRMKRESTLRRKMTRKRSAGNSDWAQVYSLPPPSQLVLNRLVGRYTYIKKAQEALSDDTAPKGIGQICFVRRLKGWKTSGETCHTRFFHLGSLRMSFSHLRSQADARQSPHREARRRRRRDSAPANRP